MTDADGNETQYSYDGGVFVSEVFGLRRGVPFDAGATSPTP